MVNKLFTTSVLILGTFSLSACNDFSTPKGVIGTAYQALKENKVKTFKKTLGDAALSQYGNEAGMATLQTLIVGKDLMAGADTPTSTESDFWGRPVHVSYSVPILSKKAGDSLDPWTPFWTAVVQCESRYYNNGGGSFPGNPPGPIPPIGREDCWGSNSPVYCRDYVTVVTNCAITDLQI